MPHTASSRIPVAQTKDQNDDAIARWGRDRHEGFRHHRHNFVQPSPLFFTQDHHPLWLGDLYRGRSAFLIAGGPSFANLDHSALRRPGVLTLGLNNSVKTFRPNLWVSVDAPENFVRSVWLDPTIQKFTPICHAAKPIFNSDTWQHMDLRVGDCPNVIYYKRNEHFNAQQFLWEDCLNWGNHQRHGGGRSVMLPALRILFTLGIRRVYLLGVDFKMDSATTYHFDQHRAPNSVKGNNASYEKLEEWFRQLRPVFEEQDFHVYNCNPESNLKAFDHVPFAEACQHMDAEFDHVNIKTERTQGLYDTSAQAKLEATARARGTRLPDAPANKSLRLNLAQLKADVMRHPFGYVEFILAHGTVQGDTVILDEVAAKKLRENYPGIHSVQVKTTDPNQPKPLTVKPSPDAPVIFNLAQLKDTAARRPPGFVDYVLSAGRIDGEVVTFDGPAQQQLKEKFPKFFLPAPPEPTVAEMASNFTAAIATWSKAGFKVVGKDVYEKRVGVCTACEHWDAKARKGLGKCKICGCSKMKFWLATSKCPHKPPKW